MSEYSTVLFHAGRAMAQGKLPVVPKLVAIEANGNDNFVGALLSAWDAGDAVLPLDPRLPAAARAALLAQMRGGQPVEDGDALVVATSGTTGVPRGVVLTHEAVGASAIATSERVGVDRRTDRWL